VKRLLNVFPVPDFPENKKPGELKEKYNKPSTAKTKRDAR